jgi:hypothetical protein
LCWEYLAITWFPNHNVTIIAALAGRLAAIAVKLNESHIRNPQEVCILNGSTYQMKRRLVCINLSHELYVKT